MAHFRFNVDGKYMEVGSFEDLRAAHVYLKGRFPEATIEPVETVGDKPPAPMKELPKSSTNESAVARDSGTPESPPPVGT